MGPSIFRRLKTSYQADGNTLVDFIRKIEESASDTSIKVDVTLQYSSSLGMIDRSAIEIKTEGGH